MNGKVAIGTALGLILGLIAGLFAGGALTNSHEAPKFQTAEHVPLQEPTSADSRPLQDQRSTPQGAPQTLGEIIAAAEIPPVPAGAGEIGGTVMSVHGAPVEGVTVSVSTSYPERRYYADLSAEERVKQEIRHARWLEVATRKAVTDADGRYSITGLAEDVSYSVTASADAWSINPRNPKQGRAKPPCEYHFVARAETPLDVHVTMADGSQPEEAAVVYRAKALSREQTAMAWRGPAKLRLTPGEWTLYAVSKDYYYAKNSLQRRSDELTLTIEEGASVEPVTLVLKPTPSIGGIISLPKGFEQLPLDVFVQAEPPASPPSGAISEIGGKTEARVWSTGSDAEWQCSNLRSGRYRVLLATEEAVVDWTDVELSEERAECNLSMPAPSHDDYVVLRVFSPAGEQLRDPEIGMTAHSSGGSYGYGPRQTVDTEGRIWLRRNAHGRDVEYEWFEIRISHSEHGEKTVRYEAESRDVMDVRLETPAWLVLTVPGWDDLRGKGLLNWQLWREDMDGRGSRMMSDDDGQNTSPIRLGPVSPGSYRLKLTLRLDTFRGVDLVEREVILVSGDNHLSESAPALYSLVIRSPEGEKLPRIELAAAPGKFHLELSGSSKNGNVYEVSHVPAGAYRLISRDGEMSVSVTGPTEVVFAPRLYNCLKLTIVPKGGRIEQLGLKDGDKLVEVDGQAIGPESRREAIFNDVITKESTTWIVMREGVRTAVTFDGRELFKILTDREGAEREQFRTEAAYLD